MFNLRRYIMVVAIALQIGIMHVHTLVLLAALSWVGSMASLAADKVRVAKKSITVGLKMLRILIERGAF
jgi:hypothetical protein